MQNPNYKHGGTGTKLYFVFRSILSRCKDKNVPTYHRYGGRGISVEFIDFLEFKNWAYETGYKEGLTIERKDNSGNYSKDNCTWVTQAEQMRNTSATKLANQDIHQIYKEYMEASKKFGEKKKLIEKYNCCYSAMRYTINKYKREFL